MEKSKRIMVGLSYKILRNTDGYEKKVVPVPESEFEFIRTEQDLADYIDLIEDKIIIFYQVTQVIRHLGLPYFAEPESRIMAKATSQELIYLLNFLEK